MLNVTSGRQSPPQGGIAIGALSYPRLAPGLERRRKGALQANIVDMREVRSQDHLGGLILLKNGRA